jgi:hypothetical protein
VDYQRPLFQELPDLAPPSYAVVVSLGLLRIAPEHAPIAICARYASHDQGPTPFVQIEVEGVPGSQFGCPGSIPLRLTKFTRSTRSTACNWSRLPSEIRIEPRKSRLPAGIRSHHLGATVRQPASTVTSNRNASNGNGVKADGHNPPRVSRVEGKRLSFGCTWLPLSCPGAPEVILHRNVV